MKNSLLLPSQYKVYGWVAFLISSILGLFCMYAEFKIPDFQLFSAKEQRLLDLNDYNLTNELALVGVIMGLLMISFAKEKHEDEYISYIRLKSWQWSVLISYLILIVIAITVYGTTFFGVLFYNVFTVLIVFIIKFNVSLYQLKREGEGNEK